MMKYYKTFEQTDSFLNKSTGNKIIYFTLIDEYDRLYEVSHYISRLQGIDMSLYRDIYDNKLWYLEVYSQNASKYNATKYLRKHCNFDWIIGFGDNHNDIPLFEACDECYAVSNAVEQLKEKATGIIGDNNSNSVAKFIAEKEKVLPLLINHA